MKKAFHILITFLFLMLITTACGKKKQQNEEQETPTTVTESQIKDAEFDNNWNVAYDENKNISKAQYDSLKLGSLSFIAPYEHLDFQIGKVLLDTDEKKLLSIKAISSGEIAEYLLSYINNNITDSLLIAYEDNVEYYSATSSVINDNKITVTTINWDYSGAEETADTTITQYTITPELTFEEIFDK